MLAPNPSGRAVLLALDQLFLSYFGAGDKSRNRHPSYPGSLGSSDSFPISASLLIMKPFK